MIKKLKDLEVNDVILEEEILFGIAQVIKKDADFVHFIRPYIIREESTILGKTKICYKSEEERFVVRISQDGEAYYKVLGNNKTIHYA